MPITFTKSYQTGDGEVFATIEEAQVHELDVLLPDTGEEVISNIVKNAEAVVNILTTKGNSRPKGRKANGATRKRKAQPETAATE